MIRPEQCRAARGLIDISQQALAGAAKVSLSTIRDFEKGRHIPRPDNLAAIKAVLESAGVEFIAANGSGPGVRLQRRD